VFGSGTLVATPIGPRRIEDIKAGDYVIGTDNQWVEVTKAYMSPYSTLVEIKNRTTPLLYAHPDTRLKSEAERPRRHAIKAMPLRTLYSSHKAVVGSYSVDFGVNCDYAYLIGVMLGNGSCKSSGANFLITSQDECVPAGLAKVLGTTWKFTGIKYKYVVTRNRNFPLYDTWLKGKTLQRKSIDLSVVATWNRSSQLALLAGLLDTDGTVHACRPGKYRVAFDNTSKSAVDAFKWLVTHLFQCRTNGTVDHRLRSTMPCYKLNINHQCDVKRLLRELDPYLYQPSKKWKEVYASMPDKATTTTINFGELKIGVAAFGIKTRSRMPFLLANGLVVVDSAPMYVVESPQNRISQAPSRRTKEVRGA